MKLSRTSLWKIGIVLAVVLFCVKNCDFRMVPYRVQLVQKTGMVKKILIYSTMNYASRDTQMVEQGEECLRLDKRVHTIEFNPPQDYYYLYCSGIRGYVRTNDVLNP